MENELTSNRQANLPQLACYASVGAAWQEAGKDNSCKRRGKEIQKLGEFLSMLGACVHVSVFQEIRVCDVNDYSFLYIKVIDARVFQEMKCQQSLNVDYHDFQEQLLELFDKIKSQEMLIGLEQRGGECKMVFYEKAKLKSLIFLTIDLDEMDRLEAINELAATVEDLKIRNKEKNEQLQAAYLEIDGLAKCVKTLEAKFTHVHQQFVEVNF